MYINTHMYTHAYSYVYTCAYYTCAFFHLATGIVRELLRLSLCSTSKALSTRAVAVSALLFQLCSFSLALSALRRHKSPRCPFAPRRHKTCPRAASRRLRRNMPANFADTDLLHKVHLGQPSRGRGGAVTAWIE